MSFVSINDKYNNTKDDNEQQGSRLPCREQRPHTHSFQELTQEPSKNAHASHATRGHCACWHPGPRTLTFFQEKAIVVSWDVNIHNCNAWHAKQRKARRGNQRENDQGVKKQKAREVEGGGVVGAVFFHVFNFFPLKISYKTTFLLFCVFFTKLSVITNFVRTGAFSYLRAQTSLQFCILYNLNSFGT